MPEDWLTNHLWLSLLIWAVVYCSDYYLTIYSARLYRLSGKEHFGFEGSLELTPQFQEDVDKLRWFSPTFIKHLILSLLALALLWLISSRTQCSASIFLFFWGALLCMEIPVHIRHFRNIIVFSRANTAGMMGKVDYKKWFSLKLSAYDLFAFSVLFLIVFAFSQSWMFAGGALSCLSTGLRHRRMGKYALAHDGQQVDEKKAAKRRIRIVVLYVMLLVLLGIHYAINNPSPATTDITTSDPSRLVGVWDSQRPQGIFLTITETCEFKTDGAIVCCDCGKSKGWWRREGKTVWIKMNDTKTPGEYYFTSDSILVPVGTTKHLSWKLHPRSTDKAPPKTEETQFLSSPLTCPQSPPSSDYLSPP